MRLFSLLILIIGSGALQAEQFQAPVTDTQWQLTTTPLECKLTQLIPGYGEASFYRQNGGQLQLTFSTYSQPATQNNVQFGIAEAPWQNSDEHLSLISVPTESGQNSFLIEGLLAQQALTHFQQGQFPVIHYRSQTSMKDISVMMSTVHLLDSLPDFQQCLTKLHPDTFDQVQFLTVYFDLEKAELSAASKKALDRLAGYIKIDNRISAIQINSHTDNHGRRNLNEPLSQQRAEAVKNYLISQHGISQDLFQLRSYVDKKPTATNKTQMGRAHNRRAEITLIR